MQVSGSILIIFTCDRQSYKLPSSTTEKKQIRFIAKHAESLVGKCFLNGQSVRKTTNSSYSEAVVIDSKDKQHKVCFLSVTLKT